MNSKIIVQITKINLVMVRFTSNSDTLKEFANKSVICVLGQDKRESEAKVKNRREGNKGGSKVAPYKKLP